MRFVEIAIPSGKRGAILGALEDEGIDYVVSDETSNRDFVARVAFPIPKEAVEHVLDRLEEAGLDDDAITVVLGAETVLSRRFERLQERFGEEDLSEERIARQEIRARATDLTPPLPMFLILTVVSVVVATAGVLLDSPAVVVGSMVIAPLIGPAMATSVGTVIDDGSLFVRGVRYQVLGFVAAVVAATVFAALVKTIHLVPPGIDILGISEVRERLAPDFLSLAVALGAGVAGAISLSSGVSASLVGVMIAVALVPPIAVIGIGVAWGMRTLVIGAAVLAVVNFLSINLAALATLYYQGYRPAHPWFSLDATRRRTLTRIGVLVVAIAVLSLFLGWVTYSSYQAATYEEGLRSDVGDLLADTDARLLDMEVTYTGSPPLQKPERVTVTVGYGSGGAPPNLADPIDDLADRRAGRDVAVTVRFVQVQSA